MVLKATLEDADGNALSMVLQRHDAAKKHALAAYSNGWLYRYGASGQTSGGRVYSDCSGLIYSYSGTARSSGMQISSAAESGSFSSLPRIHGLGLWQPGHVGVYVGGGTPTVLPVRLLDRILAECECGAAEFTVEGGRPETLTPSVLALLAAHGVTRLSVNPQTFNDATLERIGRKHTSEQIFKAYKRARKLFDINMDLIAMLPEETLDDFRLSVDTAISLSPANITVHTLYLKRGSALRTEGYRNDGNALAEQMVDYAYNAVTSAGYEPYYMYRQKYTSGNLENVGYSRPDKLCIYNVDVMEEDTTVYAAGAGAISKKVTPERNLIERCANFKEPLEYVKHFDEVMSRQRRFWEE